MNEHATVPQSHQTYTINVQKNKVIHKYDKSKGQLLRESQVFSGQPGQSLSLFSINFQHSDQDNINYLLLKIAHRYKTCS